MKIHYNQLRKALHSFTLGVLLINYSASYATISKDEVENITSVTLPKPQYQNVLGTFLVDISPASLSVLEFQNMLNDYFNLDKDHSFKLIDENKDSETGFSHYKYQHFYKDVKVSGDMIFVHAKEGKVKQVNGQVVNIKNLATTASVNNEKITSIALSHFGVNQNAKIGLVETYILKQQNKDEALEVKLVSKVNLATTHPLKSEDIIIDAHSGELVSKRNKVYKADTPSSSATFNRGTKSMTVDSYNGTFRLRDNARKISTFKATNLNGNLNSDGTFSGYTEYTSATANFTSNATKPAVEVHWGMQKTYDYYKNIHNRTSFDGNGHPLNNYYDIGNFIGDDENAFAIDETNGTDEYIGMLYGKGGSSMNPVINLDIAGHEFTHLVVSRNGSGGLDYENESGALNESFADIFGTAIEFYVNDNPNWTMGEGIFKNNVTPNYFRNLSNPNYVDTNTAYPQPDTYKGDYWYPTTNNPDDWNDYGGVHINSGVGNFWFYLLSVGGNGKNDIGNNYYVSGITIQKAEKIAYKALTTGLTSSATYLDCFNATKQAAAALYGQNSHEWDQVVNAWYAVGIGNAPAANINFEMQSKLTVFPNPVSNGEVTIQSEIKDRLTVEIFDMQGKQLLKVTDMGTKTTLNVSNYSAGMYLLKFKSNSGEYTHKLIVK